MRLLMFTFFAVTSSSTILGQHYLFYLHGKIMEDQGVHAMDTLNGYGVYEYENILNTFRGKNFTVLSEVREKNTNPVDYAHKIVNQIDSLIKMGTEPGNITVVGASKGAVISMLVSSYLKNENVNFVFLAGCNNDLLKQFAEIKFCGNILSIYERTDDIGHSCMEFKKRTALTIPHYKEIEINTGLKHGFLYKPLPEWINPTLKWAAKDYE